MREIRFRGKSIETDKWEYGNLVITDHNRLNEKEIYEGDIVQGLFADQEEPEIKGQVIYSNGQASYIVIASNNDEWELGYLDNLEVIGNIYDNLKLLGGEDESTR